MEAQAASARLDEPVEDRQESKAERFERLAPPRVERALNAIRIVAHLGNRALYEPQPEDIEAITGALRAALADMEAQFRGRMPREAFRLRR